MPAQITNYQCPTCTGPLKFSSETGKLECEYCGSSFDTAEIEALYAEKEASAAAAAEKAAPAPEGSVWSEAEAAGLHTYNCPSCGAELICDATTAATSCPYCGNPTIVPGQFSRGFRPDYVIPFKQSKEDAVAALKKHYKRRPLLPKGFADANHLDEIKGVYVPFWLFDCHADGEATYEATRTRSYTDGDYDVTETDYYRAVRQGSVAFEKIPVDGSTKMPDAHMDAIEPFDFNEMREFSTAYLPGFLADKFDVTEDESEPRAADRAKNSFVSVLAGTVTGYDSVSCTSSNTNYYRDKTGYAMLPVWLLSTRWKDKSYLFAMNGQTGKFIGDLPISKGKFFAWLGGVWGGLTVALLLVQMLLRLLA